MTAMAATAGHRDVELGIVIDDLTAFADPLLAGRVPDARWDPAARSWNQ